VPESVPDFRKILTVLHEHGCDVALIGGLAAIVHGSDRQTQDIDFAFCRARQTCENIARALAPYHPRPLGFDPTLPYVWDAMALQNMATITLETDLGRIDFLSEPSGADSGNGVIARAIQVELWGIPVKVANLDDLIAMKTAAGRPKDLLAVAELQAIKRLQEESAQEDS
jgi:predicted nucleotidyltransferase